MGDEYSVVEALNLKVLGSDARSTTLWAWILSPFFSFLPPSDADIMSACVSPRFLGNPWDTEMRGIRAAPDRIQDETLLRSRTRSHYLPVGHGWPNPFPIRFLRNLGGTREATDGATRGGEDELGKGHNIAATGITCREGCRHQKRAGRRNMVIHDERMAASRG